MTQVRRLEEAWVQGICGDPQAHPVDQALVQDQGPALSSPPLGLAPYLVTWKSDKACWLAVQVRRDPATTSTSSLPAVQLITVPMDYRGEPVYYVVISNRERKTVTLNKS